MSKLFCFIGPSGSGKSTIQHALPMKFLTHYVTREVRDGEVDGLHVNHVSLEDYTILSATGMLATSTKYADNYYGSPMSAINNIKNGTPYHATVTKDSIEQFKKLLGKENVVVIYIKPPDIATLKNRMLARGDKLEDVDKRIAHIYSTAELENEKYADYVVINDDFNKAFSDVQWIIVEELDGRLLYTDNPLTKIR